MAIHDLHYHWYFPKNVAYHIHRGLTAQNYSDEIVRLPVKPHIDYQALADGTALMQGGATSHTANISQEVLIDAAIGVLVWPAKNPVINTIKNVWSVMLRRISGMNPLPKIAAGLNAACTVNDRTSLRRAHDDHWTAVRADFVPSSKIGVDIFIIIEYLDGFLKFSLFAPVLRLMHSIHAFIHVLKTYTVRSILPNKCI